MKEKFFTPDIEDICVGYEGEIKQTNYPDKNNWIKYVFNVKEIIPVFAMINNRTVISNTYRVPYLTKEQIEAEGWKQEFVYSNGASIMIFGKLNKGYELMLPREDYHIVITKVWTLFDEQVKRDNIFKGYCKDINTFRKIIKLLGI